METTVMKGHAVTALKALPTESVNCCVTSSPYFKMRVYGADLQLGREASPEEFGHD